MRQFCEGVNLCGINMKKFIFYLPSCGGYLKFYIAADAYFLLQFFRF